MKVLNTTKALIKLIDLQKPACFYFEIHKYLVSYTIILKTYQKQIEVLEKDIVHIISC